MSTEPSDPSTTTHDSTDTDSDIDALRDEVERLQHELAKARQRISDLEERVGSSTSSTLPAPAKDYRDARVLEALDAETIVTSSDLRSLYKQHTDIRDRETLLGRIKHLAKTDAFEFVRNATWRYRGPGGGE